MYIFGFLNSFFLLKSFFKSYFGYGTKQERNLTPRTKMVSKISQRPLTKFMNYFEPLVCV